MSDFRLPPLPGAAALPKWRQNEAYQHMGLSPETIQALDQSELDEATLIAKLRERTEHHRKAVYGDNTTIDAQNAVIEAQHKEQTRTDALTENELRDELLERIDDHANALRTVATSDHTLCRAQEAVIIAEGRLARFADLDARVAEYRADQIRDDRPGGLPPDLIEQRRAQHDASELLNATRQAFINLGLEAQQAKLKVEDCAKVRDAAAIAIISRHVDGIANQIDATVERLHDLRQQALSISGLWVPMAGATGPLPVSDRVRVALRRSDTRPLVSEQIKASARDWFMRLQTDADAVME